MPNTPLTPSADIQRSARTALGVAQRLRQQAVVVRSADTTARGERSAGDREAEARAIEYLARSVAPELVDAEPAA